MLSLDRTDDDGVKILEVAREKPGRWVKRYSQVSDVATPEGRSTKESLLDLRTVVYISRTFPVNGRSTTTARIERSETRWNEDCTVNHWDQ